MCHYTIRRCCQCGSYLEVIPKICTYNKNGFCSKDRTNDGYVDDSGINEVMCTTNVPLTHVPFPFIACLYSDGNVQGIYALHKVQELLALCPSCSPSQSMGQRTMDLGGFLFHLDFERGPWERPLRICQGRYTVGHCQDKKCHQAKCEDCELTGTCGHHGPLQDFKPFADYRQSMSSLLMMHTWFLDEPDKYQRNIRKTYPEFPTPQPEPSPALIPRPPELMVSSETISDDLFGILFDIGNSFEQMDTQTPSFAGAGIFWDNGFPELDATTGAEMSWDEPIPGTGREGCCAEELQWGNGEGQRCEPGLVSLSAFQNGNLLGHGAPLAMC
jgi:hypothetical protein